MGDEKKMMKSVRFNSLNWLQWLRNAHISIFVPSLSSITCNHVESNDAKIKEINRKFKEINGGKRNEKKTHTKIGKPFCIY